MTSVRVLAATALALIGAMPAAGSEMAADGQARLLLQARGSALSEPAPMIGTVVHLEVSGVAARARVTQIFVNPTGDRLEAVYVFPLPEEAAVDGLEMRVGERLLRGLVAEREAAAEVYQRAAEEGRSSSLMAQHRPNVFTVNVANVGPGEKVEVTLELHLEVQVRAGRFNLRFPLVVAPRYAPDLPALRGPAGPEAAASPLPPVVTADRPVNPVGLRVDLDPGFPVGRVRSPSHELRIEETAPSTYAVTLAAGVVWADADFVLEWEPLPGSAPAATVLIQEAEGERYAALLVLPPTGPVPGTVLPREVLLVLDTSGSMEGEKIEQAKLALLTALRGLSSGDRFNVIQFNSQPERLFPVSVPAEPSAVVQAGDYVRGLETGGGTEIKKALAETLTEPAARGLLRQIVLITDGHVAREAQIFRYVTRHLGESRLFTVGIGAAPNTHFMRAAARYGRGSYTYVSDPAELEERVVELLARLEAPVLRDVEVLWPDPDADSLPRPIPDLYLGEPIAVVARLAASGSEARIVGSLAGRTWETAVPLRVRRRATGIDKLWARRAVEALTDRLVEPDADVEEIRRAVTELGVRHQIVTPYTSLVAEETVPSASPATPVVTRLVPLHPVRGWGPVRTVSSGIAETITVTSESPLLDERRLAPGVAMSREELDQLPASGDAWAWIGDAGMPRGRPVDAGGNRGGPVPVSAAASPDQTVLELDGLEVVAAEGDFFLTLPGPAGLAAVELSAGGTDVEAPTAGARVRLTTRRGTNQRRGSAQLRFSGDELQASGRVDRRDLPAAQALAAPDLRAGGRPRDLAATVEAGGPIRRDRFWLWGSLGRSEFERLDLGGGRHQARHLRAGLRLDAQLAGSQSAVLWTRHGEEEQTGLGADPRRAGETTWEQRGGAGWWALEDTHVFTASLYLTGSAGWMRAESDATPAGGLEPRLHFDAGNVARRTFFAPAAETAANQGRLESSYFLGPGTTVHELRLGASWRRRDQASARRVPGQGLVLTAGEVFGLPTGLAVLEAWRDGAPRVRAETGSLWAQDTFSTGRWTVNAGLRFDLQTLDNLPSAVPGSPVDPRLPAVHFAGNDAGGLRWQSPAPRLGLTYAAGLERRTLVRAGVARFASRAASDLALVVNPTSPARAIYWLPSPAAELPFDPDGPADFQLSVGFDPVLTPEQSPGAIQPGLEPELTDEASLAVEHEWWPGFVSGLSATYRRSSRLLEERLLVRDAATGEVRPAVADDWAAAGRLEGVLPGGAPYDAPYFDLRPGLAPTGGRLLANGDREQEHLGLTLSWHRRSSGRWTSRGQVTWWDSSRRLGPAFRQFDDPTRTLGSGDVDGDRVAPATGDPYGPVAYPDSRWTFQIDGLVRLPRRFRAAAVVSGRDGYPIPYARRVFRPNSGPALVQLNERLAAARYRDLVTVDARLDRELDLADLTLTASLEAFDLLDARTVLRRESDLGLTRAGFVEEVLSPRTLRLGLRLAWG